MASEVWQIHDGWFSSVHKGDVDTDTDTFSMRLYSSSSNVNNKAINIVGSVTNELPTASGYTSGGVVVALTLSESSGTTVVDTADAEWVASGGNIVARYAALIDNTTGLVVCHSTLDDTPADVTATDGNTFTVQINALGMYALAQL